MTTQEPRGQELINRYRKNYNIPVDANITEEMILAHWELEKRLTRQLLESSPENRWETFDRCYTTLYSELEWVNKLADSGTTLPSSQLYEIWPCLIGEPSKEIYETGSGKGELITYLAGCGYKCKGTEITHERGKKHVSGHPNLSRDISDGVHLDEFEDTNSYDVVVSNQVIEHIIQTIYLIISGGSYLYL